jgi:hypothetical protein
VILSDGWERGDPQLVGREMERLARLAHRIVWVNPRVSARRLLAAGRRHARGAAALRRARQRPQLKALDEVVDAIGARRAPLARRSAGCAPPIDEARARRSRGGARHPVRGQLGRDAERARPEPRQHHAGLGIDE